MTNINEISTIIHRNFTRMAWEKDKFDLEHSYICSAIAEIPYHRIPEFELSQADRANMIPCASYNDLYTRRIIQTTQEISSRLDSPRYFSIETNFAILLGIKIHNVLFISIRGTQTLYDWRTNFQVLKISERIGPVTAKFHRGFYLATMEILPPLLDELDELDDELTENEDNDRVLVYITGHSLGGAIASILHGQLRSIQFPYQLRSSNILRSRLTLGSCYTFGMPRFGDRLAAAKNHRPFNVKSNLDIVPRIPPKWLGFADSLNNFHPDGTRDYQRSSVLDFNFLRWFKMIKSGQIKRNHSIEQYQQSIHSHLK